MSTKARAGATTAPAIRRGAIVVRIASERDLDAVVSMRLEFLRELGRLPRDADEAARVTRNWLAAHVATGDFVVWVVEVGGSMVATSALSLQQRPPYYYGLAEGVEGYLLNMYTRREWQRQGIGRAILDEVLRYARGAGIRRVTLHATDAGRPLYEAAGFRSTKTEMELELA